MCIVPLSPPITGASLASENIVDYLRESHDVVVIPYQRGTLQSGTFSIIQLFRILLCCFRLIHRRLLCQFDRVYLVISSSSWGNMRDLLFMMLIGRSLREKLVVHLHGANFDICMQNAPNYRKWLNKYLFKNIRAAIVLGETFENIFDGYVARDKVKIVKNYFDSDLLIPEGRAAAKFNSSGKVKILYLSNLMKEKGYEILLEAFLQLPEELHKKAELHYAGTIANCDKESFLNKIRNRSNIFYHGCVVGSEKRDLFWGAQFFCLPTIYKFEGQPISILEAYASGCCVLTTNNGGIKDIFYAPEHGIVLDDNLIICTNELSESLQDIVTNTKKYSSIGTFNRLTAMDKYHKNIFTDNIARILFE